MLQTMSAARARAVQNLQDYGAKFSPGSFGSQTYDKAVDYALNDTRTDNEYLEHGAYRNGRWATLRERKRAAARSTNFYTANDNLAIAFEIGPKPDATYLASLGQSAETVLAWKEQYANLRRAALELNIHAGSVLDGWRDGLSVAETADSLSISQAYVKKIRAIVKTCALEVVDMGLVK